LGGIILGLSDTLLVMTRKTAGKLVPALKSGAGVPASPAELAALAPLCAVFRRYLKTQNLKYTPERADILNAIIDRDAPFEVEALMDEMRLCGHRVSKATTYRTMKLLLESGIITQSQLDRGQSQYQLVYGRDPHNTMVCVKSGQVIEFTSDELIALRDKICRQHGWDPVGHRLQIHAVSPSK
jgi:Fur family ferric uptake transcriptional regulator